MPRVSRLFLAATLSTLAALLPVTAFASSPPPPPPSLTVSVVGAQYAVGNPEWCVGGTTSSFAGYGRPNAFFNTTICHTETDILAGGIFQLVTSQRILVGQYSSGSLDRQKPTRLYAGSTLCKQLVLVKDAKLTGLTTSVPAGVTNILSGSTASGTLTHFGVFNHAGGCDAKAATITGTATLVYPT